jgi:hypothetical protein
MESAEQGILRSIRLSFKSTFETDMYLKPHPLQEKGCVTRDVETLWEAHAPNYGVTSLILAFRRLDAVHVLKCQHSLQNQHLEQANVDTPI